MEVEKKNKKTTKINEDRRIYRHIDRQTHTHKHTHTQTNCHENITPPQFRRGVKNENEILFTIRAGLTDRQTDRNTNRHTAMKTKDTQTQTHTDKLQ